VGLLGAAKTQAQNEINSIVQLEVWEKVISQAWLNTWQKVWYD
jgi:hypothetical protein